MPSQPHSSTYFNPRSGERSDHIQRPLQEQLSISIHAPANGATLCRKCLTALMCEISIHAPANGATTYTDYYYADEFKFQSTLRRTERLLPVTTFFLSWRFQSTLRRTERLPVLPFYKHFQKFQSTLRRTERPFCCALVWTSTQFQSTLRRTERHKFYFIPE